MGRHDEAGAGRVGISLRARASPNERAERGGQQEGVPHPSRTIGRIEAFPEADRLGTVDAM